MADVNQVITLGVGTPSDIEHFVLFGLGSGEVDAEVEVGSIIFSRSQSSATLTRRKSSATLTRRKSTAEMENE
jgi:hypothetical protein